MTTDRTHFNKTWLTEMPEGIGSIDTYEVIKFNINDLIDNNIVPTKLSNILYKIDLSQSAYYWYEKNNIILLGMEFQKERQGLIVRAVGKNPEYRGQPPYASQLYDAILKDNKYSIRILSDIQLSDEGFDIWKKLFSLGHKISVYDNQNPGQTFKTFNSINDLDQYFKLHDPSFRRYQYILSENGLMLAETRSYFNTRRMRELSEVSLDD
jgi:hypothetical protein